MGLPLSTAKVNIVYEAHGVEGATRESTRYWQLGQISLRNMFWGHGSRELRELCDDYVDLTPYLTFLAR